MTRIETDSIGELARAAGVSVRALHHYDAIGLLSPARTAENGYRVRIRGDALRLQEILFYRAAGLPLAEIAALLEGVTASPGSRRTAPGCNRPWPIRRAC